MKAQHFEVYRRANKSILLDFEGNRVFSEYDIGRGLYRPDDTQDLGEQERAEVANNPLFSVTNKLTDSILKSQIDKYEKENKLPESLLKVFQHQHVD